MTQSLFYLSIGSLLWILGLTGLLQSRHPVRQLLSVNIMGTGVFTIMVALTLRAGPQDPVLQALVVTGLVVAASATAFALRLIVSDAQKAREDETRQDQAREDEDRG